MPMQPMQPTQRKIVWEKWSDPVALHINKRHEDENGNLMVFKEDAFENLDLDNPCALTRVGVIPYHESNAPSKLFKFWVGHTNFDVSLRVARAIEAEPGVESLDVYTRYRFRVGIARQFNDEAVKKGIEAGLSRDAAPRSTGLGKILNAMRSSQSPWAVAILPRDGIRIVRAATPEEVHSACRLLQQQSGAEIITEDDMP